MQAPNSAVQQEIHAYTKYYQDSEPAPVSFSEGLQTFVFPTCSFAFSKRHVHSTKDTCITTDRGNLSMIRHIVSGHRKVMVPGESEYYFNEERSEEVRLGFTALFVDRLLHLVGHYNETFSFALCRVSRSIPALGTNSRSLAQKVELQCRSEVSTPDRGIFVSQPQAANRVLSREADKKKTWCQWTIEFPFPATAVGI